MPQAPATTQPATDDLRQQWDIICRLCTDAERSTLAAALTACKIVSFDGQIVLLEVPIMYRALFAEGHEERQFFMQVLKQCLGQAIQLQIRTGGMAISDDESNGSSEQQRLRLYKQAQGHPMLQMLMETFDADIVAREPSAREQWLQQFSQEQN